MLEIILAIVVGFPTSEFETTTKQDLQPIPEMYEDMPGWDCKTMGNKMCGFQAPISGQWYTIQY